MIFRLWAGGDAFFLSQEKVSSGHGEETSIWNRCQSGGAAGRMMNVFSARVHGDIKNIFFAFFVAHKLAYPPM